MWKLNKLLKLGERTAAASMTQLEPATCNLLPRKRQRQNMNFQIRPRQMCIDSSDTGCEITNYKFSDCSLIFYLICPVNMLMNCESYTAMD